MTIMPVISKCKAVVRKFASLFRLYPADPAVYPGAGKLWNETTIKKDGSDLLAIQCVPDKFYFLTFSSVRCVLSELRPGPAELVVVRAMSGAVGDGFAAELKRSPLLIWLWMKPWLRAFGPLVDGIGYRAAYWSNPLAEISDRQRAGILWRELRQQGENFSLEIDGVEVADLIIDSYLRFRPAPRFDVHSKFVRRLILQAIRDVRSAHRYFERRRPAWYLTSYSTYLEHGVPTRVAAKLGIPVWSFGTLQQFGKRLSIDDPYQTINFLEYKTCFERVADKERALEEAASQLEIRLGGGIDLATPYMRQSAYANSSNQPLDELRGAVVIFLHDFYDSPHVYPDMVFDDFWDWVCFTIDVLDQNGTLFYLKPHPNQIVLSDNVLPLLKAKYPNARWLTSDVTNVQLARSNIACGITVYGTVAHELGYLGVPTIGCARHPHVAFDFCRTAKTRNDYQNLVRDFLKDPLPKEQLRREALQFYYVHNMYGSEQELGLRRAFASLWRVCNVGEQREEDLLEALDHLTHLPAFRQRVQEIASC